MSDENQLRYLREQRTADRHECEAQTRCIVRLTAEVARYCMAFAMQLDTISRLREELLTAQKERAVARAALPTESPLPQPRPPLWPSGGKIPGKMQDGSYASTSATNRPAAPTEAPMERGPPTLELEPPTRWQRGSSEPDKNVSRR